jgi:ABC-type Zn uptake system ZnuABC Zn-binding protein ZnuA
VVQLVPDLANPHTYSPSAKQRAALDGADVLVTFGHGYEETLPIDEISAPAFAIAESVGELREFAEGELPEDDHGHGAAEDHDEHHAAGARDPHVWMDPTRLAVAAPKLAAMLAKADPEHADDYRGRARAHADRLRALDAELREILAPVRVGQRKLVTSHESMGYFADRYDFEFVGAPFGLAPEAETSARAVAEIVSLVRAKRVPAVFAQQGDNPKVMRQIAREAGVAVVDDLLVETPGPQGATYADAMRHNARRIAEALAR